MQLGTIQRVGDKGIERKVNVRIVAATNRDIESSIQVGILRADFRYRFRETIHVPPLRSRQVDIPHFVKHFLRKYGNKIHIEAKVVECLKSYSWPGNVRELESLIERWSVLHAGGTVMASHLPPELKQSSRDFNMPLSFSSVDEIMPLRDLQAKYMQAVLEFCGGDKKKAATALGISRQQWYR
jgi:transcriptional regulator with PAS, ATPase and Fis domain